MKVLGFILLILVVLFTVFEIFSLVRDISYRRKLKQENKLKDGAKNDRN